MNIRRLPAILIFVILAYPGFSQKNLTREEFRVTKDRSSKIGYKRYDSRGNLVEQASLDGNPFYSALFNTYDSSGLLKKSELWQMHLGKKIFLSDSVLYAYNFDNKLIRETEFKINRGITRAKNYVVVPGQISSVDSVFKVPPSGNRSLEVEIVDTVFYNKAGEIDSSVHYLDGKFSSRQVYQFNAKERIKKEYHYDGSPNHLWSTTEWKMDEHNKILQESWKVMGSSLETKVFEYDKAGLLKKILFYSDGKYICLTELKYTLN
jgi:hypothetical protein